MTQKNSIALPEAGIPYHGDRWAMVEVLVVLVVVVGGRVGGDDCGDGGDGGDNGDGGGISENELSIV